MSGTLLFVDTNIWLDEFRYQPPTKAGDISALASAASALVMTKQVRDEFLKNLGAAVAQGLQDLEKGQFPPRVNHLQPNHNAAKKVLKGIQTSYQNDPAWLILESLCRPRPLFLSETSSEWKPILVEAEDRRKLNKPPGKDKHTTLGDHINWLWALNCCTAQRASLVVCARDNDYGQPGNPGVINHSLNQEFTEHVGPGYSVGLTNNLRAAIKSVALPPVKPPRILPPYRGSMPSLLRKRYPDEATGSTESPPT